MRIKTFFFPLMSHLIQLKVQLQLMESIKEMYIGITTCKVQCKEKSCSLGVGNELMLGPLGKKKGLKVILNVRSHFGTLFV